MSISADLTDAVKRGDAVAVQALLANGADVNTKDSEGNTPLTKASWDAKDQLVELLLAHGADVNAKGAYGTTALGKACYSYDREKPQTGKVIQALLANGADINTRSDDGYTPLMTACWYGKHDLVELLLARGADVNARNERRGLTALLQVSRRGASSKVVDLLLAHGADANARDERGWTALMMWASFSDTGPTPAIDALLAKGADVNAKDKDGWTALMIAVANDRRDLARGLLAKGADVNAIAVIPVGLLKQQIESAKSGFKYGHERFWTFDESDAARRYERLRRALDAHERHRVGTPTLLNAETNVSLTALMLAKDAAVRALLVKAGAGGHRSWFSFWKRRVAG